VNDVVVPNRVSASWDGDEEEGENEERGRFFAFSAPPQESVSARSAANSGRGSSYSTITAYRASYARPTERVEDGGGAAVLPQNRMTTAMDRAAEERVIKN